MKRTQILNLGKHFSIIDSPVPFYLVDNYGFRAYRTAGAWQFDNWKLLPEKFHKIYPVYTLSIEWDSGENDDIQPIFMDTDLDLGDGIAGVNGQPVNISSPVIVSEVKKPVIVESKDYNLVDSFEWVDDRKVRDVDGRVSYFIKNGTVRFDSKSSTVGTVLVVEGVVVISPFSSGKVLGVGTALKCSGYKVTSDNMNFSDVQNAVVLRGLMKKL